MRPKFCITASLLAMAILCASQTIAQGQTIMAPATSPWWWSAFVTPLLTGILGVAAGYIAISFDVRKTSNQELIKKRIAIYDDVAPKLNDLLCFFLCLGSWKSLPPPLMVQRKRELDHIIHVYGPLFSQTMFDQYHRFIQVCFKTFTGVGRDASLRANRARLQAEWGDAWKVEWNDRFVAHSDVAAEQEVMDQYRKLMTQLAAEIRARRL